MPFEIRVDPFGNARDWGAVVMSAFGDTVDDAELADNERLYEPDRRLAAFDGDRCVGVAGAFSHRLTVPGGEVASCGVTAVGVIQTYRRRGVLSDLMRYQLDDAIARGEVVAALFASEGGIYGRFGYGIATQIGSFLLDRAHAAFRDPVRAEGTIRPVDVDEAKRLFPPVYERVRPHWPGFTDRTDAWWDLEVLSDRERRRHGASAAHRVVYEADGGIEGYAIYRLKPDWDNRGPKGEMRVQELLAATPRATRELWRHVLDVDLMAATRAWMQPVDHPLLHLLAEPRRLGFEIVDGLWIRLLALPGALESRSYEAADAVTFELRDDYFPANRATWRLDTGGDRPRVERADGPADLALDVQTLGALYLGAWRAGALADAGRIEERAPAAVQRLDRLFRTPRAPWVPHEF